MITHLEEVVAAPSGSRLEIHLTKSLDSVDFDAIRILQALVSAKVGLRLVPFSRALTASLSRVYHPRALGSTLADRLVSLTSDAPTKERGGVPVRPDAARVVVLGAWYAGSIFACPPAQSVTSEPRHRARLQWWLTQVGAPLRGQVHATFRLHLTPLRRVAAVGLLAALQRVGAEADLRAILARAATALYEADARLDEGSVALRNAAMAAAPPNWVHRREAELLAAAITLGCFWGTFVGEGNVHSIRVAAGKEAGALGRASL